MKHIWLAILLAIALAPAAAQQRSLPQKQKHPLAQPSASDVSAAVAVIRADSRTPPTVQFQSVGVREPVKATYLKEPSTLRHEILCVCYDPRQRVTLEISVDPISRTITEFKRLDDVQPLITPFEFDSIEAIVHRNVLFRRALERRGLHIDSVVVEPWASGVPRSSFPGRLVRCIFFVRSNGEMRYDRPVEGLHMLVNTSTRQAMEVHDKLVIPVANPAVVPKPSPRPSPKPQPRPKGDPQLIVWNNWSFRWVLQPKDGLVLYDVAWNDKGRRRPIAHRLALSEMFVPYGDTSAAWTWRTAFDAGEYGVGLSSRSLTRGLDVPATASTHPIVIVDRDGNPITINDAVAWFEKPSGLLWRHVNLETDVAASKSGTEFTIQHCATVGNYDYMLSWIFAQDGTIRFDVALTGIMLVKGTGDTVWSQNLDSRKTSHMVQPGLLAPFHQHFFSVRLDLDIDGPDNSVHELDIWSPPAGSENRSLNAMMIDDWEFRFEQEACTSVKPSAARRWNIQHASATNSFGMPTAYCLVPGINAQPFLKPEAAPRKRAAFINHSLWVTHHKDHELYAAGPYPNQSSAGEGLPRYVSNNESIRNRDVVVWYTFGVTHVTRPEDWPIMPVEHAGFSLMPMGFFNHNPTIR
jgi:primary-amine oxidase